MEEDITVIKIGGSVLHDQNTLSEFCSICSDLVKLKKSFVIVHGGGKHISGILKRNNIDFKFINGQRITTNEMIPLIETALWDEVNYSLSENLAKSGVSVKRIHGGNSGLFDCEPWNDQLEYVGRIVKVNSNVLMTSVIKEKQILLIAPLGVGNKKEIYNINADWAAVEIALSLKAKSLIYLSDCIGLVDRNNELIDTIESGEIPVLIDNNTINNGMHTKVLTIQEGLKKGIQEVCILDGNNPNNLQSYFDGKCNGTRFIDNSESDECINNQKNYSIAPTMKTYKSLNISFKNGKGCWLTETSGLKYLDGISGIGVNSLGHKDRQFTKNITKQLKKVVHTSNLFEIPQQKKLAKTLTEIAGMDNAFFCNSGAEANETAIKIARKYGISKGIDNPKIVVYSGAFHGRTMATLSATPKPHVQKGFGAYKDDYLVLPYDCNILPDQIMDKNICAVLVEPIQGEGGVNIPNKEFLPMLRKLCDTNQFILICDEVQTGIGRTGSFFSFQQSKILPDLVTVAKGLGNGIPIGACLARGKASEILSPGDHGSTFGGNYIACTAGLSVLDRMIKTNLPKQVQEAGTYILFELKKNLKNNSQVKEIRGRGLMIAIELSRPVKDLAEKALTKRILINVIENRIIRLLPPLIINKKDSDFLIRGLVSLLSDLDMHS